MNPVLFKFENKFDNEIDKYIKKYDKGKKKKAVEKRYIKGILGAKGRLDNKNLAEQEIEDTVKKFVELYDKHKTLTKVFACWDSAQEKIKGKYTNQDEIDRTIAICNFYLYRDKICNDNMAMLESKRIAILKQRQINKEVPFILPLIAVIFLILIALGLKQITKEG